MTLAEDNPYGFYPDRTKYRLTNLDGQLQPAPHTHVMADIVDYDPPSVDISWINGYISPKGVVAKEGDGNLEDWIPHSIITPTAAAVPVEKDKVYVFAVNQGYQGRVLLYDGDGDFTELPEFKEDPKIYPILWKCPEDGTVRFCVQHLDADKDDAKDALTPSEAVQVGLLFREASIADIMAISQSETDEETKYYYQEKNIHGTTRGYGLTVYRRGHNAAMQLIGWTAPINVATPEASPSPAGGSVYALIKGSDWFEVEKLNFSANGASYSGKVTEEGVIDGLPERFFVAGSFGDMYVHTDRNMNSDSWLNLVQTPGKIDQADLVRGDMVLWSRAKTTYPDGFLCVSSFSYTCAGKNPIV